MCTVGKIREHSSKGVQCTDWNLTECVAVTHLGPPTAHKMYLVFWNGSHLWVPLSHKLRVLIHFIWLYLVEDD